MKVGTAALINENVAAGRTSVFNRSECVDRRVFRITAGFLSSHAGELTVVVADTLQAGYYSVAAGCIPCDCAHTGNVSCHAVSGHCYCSPGVGGARCTECAVGYYDFTPDGCKCQYNIRVILHMHTDTHII